MIAGAGERHPSTPLARLLAMAYRQLIDDLHARLAAQGWEDVRRPYGFVLLALREREATTTELAALLEVSKQAVSKLLDGMEAGGYVRRTADADDARVKVVALADGGRRLLAAVEGVYADLEGEWTEVIGAPAVEQIRAGLATVLRGRHGGTLPPVRPTA